MKHGAVFPEGEWEKTNARQPTYMFMGEEILDMDYLPLKTVLINSADTHCNCRTPCTCGLEPDACLCTREKIDCDCVPLMGWYYKDAPYVREEEDKDTPHPVDIEVLGPDSVRSKFFIYMYWKARCEFSSMNPMGVAEMVRRVAQLKRDDFTPTTDACAILFNLIRNFRGGKSSVKNKELGLNMGTALLHAHFTKYCHMIDMTDPDRIRGEFAAFLEQNAKKSDAHCSAKIALAMHSVKKVGPAELLENMFNSSYAKQYAAVGKMQDSICRGIKPYLSTMMDELTEMAQKYNPDPARQDISEELAFSALYLFFEMELPEVELNEILCRLDADQKPMVYRIRDLNQYPVFVLQAMAYCKKTWRKSKYNKRVEKSKTEMPEVTPQKPKRKRNTKKTKTTAEAAVAQGEQHSDAE